MAEAMETKLARLKERLLTANRDIAELQDKLIASQREAESANKVKADFERLQSQLNETGASEGAMEALKEMVAQKEEKFKQLSASAERQRETDTQNITTLRAQLAEAESQLARIREDAAASLKQSAKGDREHREQSNELNQLRRDKASLSARVMDLETQLERLPVMEQQIASLRTDAARVSTMEKQLAELSEKAAEATASLDQERADLKALQKKYDKSNTLLGAARSKSEAESARAGTLERSLKGQEQQCKALEAEVSRLHEASHEQIAEIAEYKVRLISAEGAAEANTQEFTLLRERYHESSMQEAALRSKLTELQTQPPAPPPEDPEAAKELQASRMESEHLRAQLEQAQSRIAQLEVDATFSDSMREQAKAHEQALGEISNKLAALESGQELKGQAAVAICARAVWRHVFSQGVRRHVRVWKQQQQAELQQLARNAAWSKIAPMYARTLWRVLVAGAVSELLHAWQEKQLWDLERSEREVVRAAQNAVQSVEVQYLESYTARVMPVYARLVWRQLVGGQIQSVLHQWQENQLWDEEQQDQQALHATETELRAQLESTIQQNRSLIRVAELKDKELEQMKEDRESLVERATSVGKDAANNLRLVADLRRELETVRLELAAAEHRNGDLKRLIEAGNQDVQELQATLLELSQDFGCQLDPMSPMSSSPTRI